ncbi:MAG: cytochrome c biogenesis protein ResB, partial [Planctomycetota bacterium]
MATATNPSTRDSGATNWFGSEDSLVGKLSVPRVLEAAGSLKLTVVLFALSIVLVLVGTLAQDEMNMQQVKERYFLSWIAPMYVDDFFPQAFYRHATPIRGIIPFPGGALIGTLLMVNLLAAKITRFRLQASGTRLVAALAFMVLGVTVAGMIVFLGHSDEGLQGTPPISYGQLWAAMLASTAIAAVGCVMAGASSQSKMVTAAAYVTAFLLGTAVLACLVSGWRIGDPGLRIVWQLAKGLGAGVILLVGCQLAFGKQGGNVLLHLGVGLLMVGQFAFGDRQLEQRLSLVEGASTNTFVNLDKVELQIIRSVDEAQEVIAVPASRLSAAAASEAAIRDDQLPFAIRVHSYFPNSGLAEVKESEAENPATDGMGTEIVAVQREPTGGAKSEINLPSAYLELIDIESDKPIGTYLVSQLLNDREMLVPGDTTKDLMDTIQVADSEFQLGLRMHREVKPYWVHLEDVRRVNYSGTDTPRDYSSFIRIVDPETGEDRRERVWMNNPLRYRGETFYQSNYTPLPGGKELTGIQVVRNSGWLIPYVACSITGLGMLVHFWGTLTRFIARRRRETSRSLVSDSQHLDQGDDAPKGVRLAWAVPAYVAALVLACVLFLLPPTSTRNAMKPGDRDTEFDFYRAGQIPVQFGGRVMPLDAYARQTVKAMTNKEAIKLENAPGKIKDRTQGRSLAAIQWLMEVAVDEPRLSNLPMFRIDADEVLTELGLGRRSSKLYSLDDLRKNLDQFSK